MACKGAFIKASSFSFVSNTTVIANMSIIEKKYDPRNFLMIYQSIILNGLLNFITYKALQAGGYALQHFTFPCSKSAVDDVLASFLRQPHVESEVVNRGNLHGQDLVGDE